MKTLLDQENLAMVGDTPASDVSESGRPDDANTASRDFSLDEGEDMDNWQPGSQPPEQQTDSNDEGSIFQKYQSSILEHEKEYKLAEPVISIVQDGETKSFLTLKSISLWHGKQKSKKTTVIVVAVSQYIRQNRYNSQIGTYFIPSVSGKVLWADTEQGEGYAARTMKTILRLADLNKSENLIFCDIRQFSPTERLEIIKVALETDPEIRLVIIDGLVDLMNDFMDAAEGHSVVTQLLKLCSAHNVHICVILHQNKADNNARAHVGTISSQKCELEISVKKDDKDRSQSHVECVNSRGLPFESFAVRWAKGALPCIISEAEQKEVKKPSRAYQEGRDILKKHFNALSAYTYTEAGGLIMAALGCSEATANRRIKEFVAWGFLSKGDDERYRTINYQELSE